MVTSVQKFLIALRSHKVISLLSIAVILAIGIYAYQIVAIRLERSRFEEARMAIDKLYADIVAEVGPPDSHRRISECSRQSVEFAEGPLSCDVSTDLAFGVVDTKEASQLNAAILSVVSSNSDIFKPASEPAVDIAINLAPGTMPDNSVSYYTVNGLLCAIKHTYDMPREIQLTINDPSKKIFGVSMGCDGDARAEYYPINS